MSRAALARTQVSPPEVDYGTPFKVIQYARAVPTRITEARLEEAVVARDVLVVIPCRARIAKQQLHTDGMTEQVTHVHGEPLEQIERLARSVHGHPAIIDKGETRGASGSSIGTSSTGSSHGRSTGGCGGLGCAKSGKRVGLIEERDGDIGKTIAFCGSGAVGIEWRDLYTIERGGRT